MNVQKVERRRGLALESAILDAAWQELVENGYAGLTIDAVAKRAKTSRPVLYRRWPDRGQLAAAAIQHFMSDHPVHVPDMGDVREEMISLMRQYLHRGIPLIMLCTMEMNDYFKETKSLPVDLREKILRDEKAPLQDILLRGVRRGEIDGKKLKPRIISLADDLLRHEFLMTFQPPSDEVIAEVIDDVFLPLVRP